MTRTKLIGARDPHGIRPLVLGDLDGKPIFCSETCALDIIGANSCAMSRTAKWSSAKSSRTARSASMRPFQAAGAGAALPVRVCLFRPAGQRWSAAAAVYDAQEDRAQPRQGSAGRGRCGGAGARFGRAGGARLCARRAGIPFELGIIRNHYVGRPSSSRRNRSAPSA
jgi:amidophosphoribosyltransferase